VEHDHPHALEFLRKDCSNVRDFFIKCGLEHVLTTRELFEFITDININNENMDQYLEKAMDLAINRQTTAKDEVDEEVFKQVYIPRTLKEVENFEDHQNRVEEGDKSVTDELFYRQITGINFSLTGAAKKPLLLAGKDGENANNNNGDASSVATNDNDDDDDAGEVIDEEKMKSVKFDFAERKFDYKNIKTEDLDKGMFPPMPKGGEGSDNSGNDDDDDDDEITVDDASSMQGSIPASSVLTGENKKAGEDDDDDGENDDGKGIDFSKIPKKERKKLVKELKREKRQNKIPKYVKKRAEKLSSKK